MKKRYNGLMGVVTVITVALSLSSCAPTYVAARPGPPVYARPVAPGPGYVWINDNWVMKGGRYEYVHGYWAPPRANRVWVEGNWNSRGRGYHWTPGRWQHRR